ncbi:LADA_0F03510g1_1 [Lachancea dasiensis]|uniref:LADA_0F03510g1_1 n=1 Tax=Lachancea dasiensis TaxID=1072105 RepID=A0A1G4JIV0_9SACH|nr:LADA_0F03510g1_1 [Lachancea dasiensis]
MRVQKLLGLSSAILTAGSLCAGSQLVNIEKQLGIDRIDLPHLDLSASSNNNIQLLGNFEDLNIYRYSGQSNFTGQRESNSSNSQKLIYLSNNTLVELYSPSNSNETFQVDHIVPLGSDSFILSGSGVIDNHKLERQILLNLSTLSYKPIFDQDLKQVNAIEVVNDKVYFGGTFTYEYSNQTVHSIIAWDAIQEKIEVLPFGGFNPNSNVNSIIQWDEENLIFAGNFTTVEKESALMSNTTLSNSSNTTVPELSHEISLKSATMSSTGEIHEDQLICPSLSSDSLGWLQRDTTEGGFEVTLGKQTRASKIRVYNSPNEQDQVSLFRVLTSPANGIMNLTYLDPSTGNLKSCDAWCPLLSTSNLTAAASATTLTERAKFLHNRTTVEWSTLFQDFAFVNDVPISSLNFEALASYGSNVGLRSIELFEEQISVYANNSLNYPSCEASSSEFSAELSPSFSWHQGSAQSSYVYTTFDNTHAETPSVKYSLNVLYPGNYTINLLTPGCLADSSCDGRGTVNATFYDGLNKNLLSTKILYQNNDYDKYDNLYAGHLEGSYELEVIYHEPIVRDADQFTMVADEIEIFVVDFASSVFDYSDETVFNGLVQYSVNNQSLYTHGADHNSTIDLAKYAQTVFPKYSELYAARYKENLTLLTSSGDISTFKWDSNSKEWSSDVSRIGTKIRGLSTFSGGLVITGSFNESSTGALGFNGTLFSFPVPESTSRVCNLTLEGHEFLMFDNHYAINVSTQDVAKNTSKLSFSASSSGSNYANDILLQGDVVRNDYTELNGAFPISPQLSKASQALPLFSGKIPYDAIYIDNSTAVYSYFNTQANSGSYGALSVKNNSQISDLSYEWSNNVAAMAYLEDESMLAIGLEKQSIGPQFILRNLSTNENVADFSWHDEVSLNAFIFFERNNSVLVGGSFALNDTNCSGLCLYNYRDMQWSAFFNDSIRGNVSSMQLLNKTCLLVSGSFNVNGTSHANIATISLEDGSSQIISEGDEIVTSYISTEDSLENSIAVSKQKIRGYANGGWKTISSEFTSDSVFGEAHAFSLAENSGRTKRQNSQKVIVVTGNLIHEKFGNINAAIFDFNSWLPFLSTTKAISNSLTNSPQIFSNQDISSKNSYDGYLHNIVSGNPISSSGPSSHPSASSQPMPSNNTQSSGNIDRGFIVLIGLALSMATLAVLGILGTALSYFFGDSGDRYQSVKPRIDESEMIDTVPPEKLMKFI